MPFIEDHGSDVIFNSFQIWRDGTRCPWANGQQVLKLRVAILKLRQELPALLLIFLECHGAAVQTQRPDANRVKRMAHWTIYP
jgi:hypothetical protein